MIKKFFFLGLILCGIVHAKPPQISSAWVATDALGRKLPGYKEAGKVKDDKFVALFYWTWHVGNQVDNNPVNVNDIVTRYPQAVNDYNHPVWVEHNSPRNHWDEPLFGYYRTTDAWVLRKHAEMLADAGVDVVVFDCTNGTLTWKDSYDVLGEVWLQARRDGVRTPDIAFLCPFKPSENSEIIINKLYNDIYKQERFKDLWFYWDGKPLIMAYPDNIPEPQKSFFTFRPCQPDYRRGPERKDQWGWLEVFPQHGFVEYAPGKYEMVTVGVSQNATNTLAPAAMNDLNQVYGRSYTSSNGVDKRPNASFYGLNFQEQWNRAFELDPKLVFITGWNEWVAGRYKEWQGTENAFPDQFCDEYSRDIEPMKGGHGDNYYLQLISNIRRFKGMPSPSSPAQEITLIMDGQFKQWDAVTYCYHDCQGDTLHRHCPGYGTAIYENQTGRNDFVLAKVAHDNDHFFFYVETKEPITSQDDPHWMMLLIDADRDKKTGWEGYDLIVNQTKPNGNMASLRQYCKGEWKNKEMVRFNVLDNKMELCIPRAMMCQGEKVTDMEFKWVDNVGLDNIMDFYQLGDAAPSGRFNYYYTTDTELK
jgi:hypothetical protein